MANKVDLTSPYKFPLGKVVATPGAIDAFGTEFWMLPAWPFLMRHAHGDWGEVPPEDSRENQESLKAGYRIVSAYTMNGGAKIWIITEADRSSTCILTPTEY